MSQTLRRQHVSAIVPVSRAVNRIGENRPSGVTSQPVIIQCAMCCIYSNPYTVFFGQWVFSASLGTLKNASLGHGWWVVNRHSLALALLHFLITKQAHEKLFIHKMSPVGTQYHSRQQQPPRLEARRLTDGNSRCSGVIWKDNNSQNLLRINLMTKSMMKYFRCIIFFTTIISKRSNLLVLFWWRNWSMYAFIIYFSRLKG